MHSKAPQSSWLDAPAALCLPRRRVQGWDAMPGIKLSETEAHTEAGWASKGAPDALGVRRYPGASQRLAFRLLVLPIRRQDPSRLSTWLGGARHARGPRPRVRSDADAPGGRPFLAPARRSGRMCGHPSLPLADSRGSLGHKLGSPNLRSTFFMQYNTKPRSNWFHSAQHILGSLQSEAIALEVYIYLYIYTHPDALLMIKTGLIIKGPLVYPTPCGCHRAQASNAWCLIAHTPPTHTHTGFLPEGSGAPERERPYRQDKLISTLLDKNLLTPYRGKTPFILYVCYGLC